MGKGKEVSDRRRRQRSYRWGIAAEVLALLLLSLKGYAVVARRYRNPHGEIDVVARRGRTLAFIEVKARMNKDEALFSVTPHKQQRVLRAAEGFIATHAKYAQHDLRFDVMVVTSPWRIHHLTDAWRA